MNQETKPGDIVQCTFLDHCEDGHEPLLCSVFGILVDINDNCLVIRSWNHHNEEFNTEHNRKDWCIVRSAIIETKTLRPL